MKSTSQVFFILNMDMKSWTSCLITLTLLIGGVRSDFDQDKKECQDQLLSLSPCINFVTGDSKSPPTPTCCTALKTDATKSQLCLCILVKDRNEPGLGFKLNATLALSLIPICHAPINATLCPELLHLAPHSPEAQVFEQFDSNSTSSGEIISSSSTKSGVKRFGQAAIIGVSIWILVSVSCSI